ncbi:uncharacterized protein LOC110367438 [Fundulus heteroclitus]|uniref:uncharacterized protein LOC110367438 n=1 Tax=Fundulus heteroclitus TaxID=8078 RepID=UPI00165AB5FD|nr:uncharacterized protein LOC110367438 [Fundulus heteroclitus]
MSTSDGLPSSSQPIAVSGGPPPASFAVAVKIPDFWLHDPQSWFFHVEAQFALRGITSDDTKYHYVVSALDPPSTRRAMSLLRNPPADGKYSALKHLLLRRYSLSDAERAEKLLSLSGLGDGSALELMESMLSLLGDDEGGFLFIHLFLRQLPAPVRIALANSSLLREKDYRSLAEEADRILLASKTFTVQSLAKEPTASSSEPLQSSAVDQPSVMAAIATRKRQKPAFCFYHQRFGVRARRCLPPCSFKPPGNDQADAC